MKTRAAKHPTPLQRAYVTLSVIEDAKDLHKAGLTLPEYHMACEFVQTLHESGKARVLAKAVAEFFETCGLTVLPPHDYEVCYTVKV